MRKNMKIAVALATVISMTQATTGYAEISDFLSGGTSGVLQKAEEVEQDTESEDAGGSNIGSAFGSGVGTGLDLGLDNATSTVQSDQNISMVSCTDSQTGLTVARAAVPEGYSVTSETTWCGLVQNPDFPASVFVDAVSPDGSVELTYESPLEFVHVLNAEVNGFQYMTHTDWQVNYDFYTTMLQYMNASQYCDFLATAALPGATGTVFIKETPVTQEQQAALQANSEMKLNQANQLLSGANEVYVDQVQTTAAERTYRYTDSSGKTKIMVAYAVVEGVHMVQSFSAYGMGQSNTTVWLWSVPCRYCMMVDEDKYEESYKIFESFCTNTTISDQFRQACKELSQTIVQTIVNAQAASINSVTDYVQDSFSSDIGSTDDSYSYTEAWDDVIMDRNDYTLSSGDSVKVDTSYDYVYEMPDGNVYATNSALDEPAGGTLLYAN